MGHKYHLGRRKFLSAGLTHSALGALSPLLGSVNLWASPVAPDSARGLIIGEGIEKKFGLDEVVPSMPRRVFFWQEGQKKPSQIDVPTPVHDFVQNPNDPKLVLCIPKWGKEICWIDLRAGKWTEKFNSGEDRRFFGHGLVSPDGKFIILSEQNDRTGRGELSFRDINSLKVLDRIETMGVYPHQVAMTSDRKSLVVANWGNKSIPSSLAFFDFSLRKHLHSIEFKEKQRIGHLFVTKEDQIVVSGQIDGLTPLSESSMVLVIKGKKDLHELQVPEALRPRFSGEVASISLSRDKKIVSAVNFSGQGIFNWDFRTLEFLRHDPVVGAKALVQHSSSSEVQLVRTASSSQLIKRVPSTGDFRLETHLANSRLILSPHLSELNAWSAPKSK